MTFGCESVIYFYSTVCVSPLHWSPAEWGLWEKLFQAEQSEALIIQKWLTLRDLTGLNAKSVKRNSFRDSAKGQVDVLSDKRSDEICQLHKSNIPEAKGLSPCNLFGEPQENRQQPKLVQFSVTLLKCISELISHTLNNHRWTDETWFYGRHSWSPLGGLEKESTRPQVRNTVHLKSHLL